MGKLPRRFTQGTVARRAIGRLLAPRAGMLTAAARSSIESAVRTSAATSGVSFQEGRDSVLLLVEQRRPSLYPTAVAIEAVREAGYAFVGARTLEDGRAAVEFAPVRLGHSGIAQLCHQNERLAAAALAGRGWIVAPALAA